MANKLVRSSKNARGFTGKMKTLLTSNTCQVCDDFDDLLNSLEAKISKKVTFLSFAPKVGLFTVSKVIWRLVISEQVMTLLQSPSCISERTEVGTVREKAFLWTLEKTTHSCVSVLCRSFLGVHPRLLFILSCFTPEIVLKMKAYLVANVFMLLVIIQKFIMFLWSKFKLVLCFVKQELHKCGSSKGCFSAIAEWK